MEQKSMGTGIQKNILGGDEMDHISMPQPRGLGVTYFQKMLENKDEIALTCGITGHNQTYGQLLQESIRAAIAMRARGIKPNDVITICSNNYPDCFIPYHASLLLGAVSANLDPSLPLPEIAHMLKQIRPKMIFVDSEEIKLMKLSLRESGIDAPLVVFGDAENNIPFSSFLFPCLPRDENLGESEKDFKPFEVENVKDTAAIVFSSGTTGLPKGTCLSHYGLLGHMYHSIYPVLSNALPGFVILVFSNLFCLSSITTTLYSVLNGCNQIIYPKFDVDEVWTLIKEYKVNLMFLTPLQIMGMCKTGPPQEADTSCLKFVLLTGDSISKEQMSHVRKCLPGTLVMNTYGQTELSGFAIQFRPIAVPNDRKLMEEKPDSCGRPMPGFTYKIVDPKREEILAPNQEGELRIKTEFAMGGYYNMDSSYVWDSDGFMKTGDIAYYDDDQCFFIVDRIKNLLTYQAWQIFPAKLEAIFYTYPAVQACLVIGIPHPVDGDHLLGVVVLKEEAVGKVIAEDIQKFVDGRVDEQEKLRAGVKIVQEIPVTITVCPRMGAAILGGLKTSKTSLKEREMLKKDFPLIASILGQCIFL